MSRTAINFVLDSFLLVITLSLLLVSGILRFVFPLASTSAGWTLWGHGYDAWANLHFVLVCVIGLSVLLHLMLHWSWVCGVVITRILKRSSAAAKLDDGTRTLYGVAMLIFVLNVLGILIATAYFAIEPPTLPG